MEKQLHPFVDVIMEAQLPLRWKMLNIDRYDRLLDPDEHVDPFVTQMNLFTNDDAIMCRVFPTTLKGATLHWYTHLLRNSIDSFVTLVTQFEAQHDDPKRNPQKFVKDKDRTRDQKRERERIQECSKTRETIKAQHHRNTPLETQLRGVINTIVGGFMRGSSNSARKWHVRNLKMIDSVEGEKKPTRSMPPIIFIDEDFGNIDQCHNNPMVVKIEAANFLVC
ncbi:hypothetical protein JHK85_019158 [Glycine max]|nr:hypothetical protein JHK85_019158 [Glycine max]KAG5037900.1 hypothetical protein JHK86_018740 [Glycine max]